MAAKESRLSFLHNLTAEHYVKMLEVGGTVVGKDEEGEDIIQPMTPAALQAINKFLKDNEITCAPDEDNAVGEIEDRLRLRNARKEARQAARKASQEELTEAGGAFLGGINMTAMQ